MFSPSSIFVHLSKYVWHLVDTKQGNPQTNHRHRKSRAALKLPAGALIPTHGSCLSLTAARGLHPLSVLLWYRRSVVSRGLFTRPDPVSEQHVRVWVTPGSWWFSTTRPLLPFKQQLLWDRPSEAAAANTGTSGNTSAANTIRQLRRPCTLSKTTPLYSALFKEFHFRQSWLTRSQTGAFRPPHLRGLGFADGSSTRCGERQLEKCFFRSRLLAGLHISTPSSFVLV